MKTPTQAQTILCISLAGSGLFFVGVADLRYERLNMQVIETRIHKTSEFSTYFFHTLIKQRLLGKLLDNNCISFLNILRMPAVWTEP
ncbi:hypothetical protein QT970_13975 [Microcoleus sp. herbarium8]|uniref:hypothetical protein n=1 Tax=Microcoleus sp. herbarium8 TaxID=3055436 RepID=UPI002FCF168E